MLAQSLRIAATLALSVFATIVAAPVRAADPPRKPNVIFILADDLGYGDLGCYGQKQIRTPHLDRMAAEGTRFTDCYAGCTVCAPSRCALMTGLHTGHARIRGNAQVPLEASDVTIAKMLKSAGYSTGAIGKWALGEPGSTGAPNKQGFDFFYGYVNQTLAHNYYPDYLWRNEEKVLLPNVVSGGVATRRVVYSHDLLIKEAFDFINRSKDGPFFLYLALTIPHANNEGRAQGMEVPDDKPYSNETWPQQEKNMAAMVTRMDADLGRLFARLKELKLDETTLVFFTSDNGPHQEGGNDPQYFKSAGPLRGIKRTMYEGGIRVPMIVRWPGQVAAGAVSDFAWANWDVFPTLAELVGAPPPKGIDGISVVPTLLGAERAGRQQKPHDFLYWEFHEGGFSQAVRMGNWKAVRTPASAALELYDLKTDLAERNNVAYQHADVVAKIETYLKTSRTDSPSWPVRQAN